MIKNDTADMHYLTQTEQIFFEHRVKEINDKLVSIVVEHELKGQWTISSDYKWLVKIGD